MPGPRRGRGKAGGVKVATSKDEVRAFAEQWLGKNLVTYQTDAKGQPVNTILVESCSSIAKELYLGAVVDRSSRRVVFMASTEGGMEIEKVAHETPELIHKAVLDPLTGPQPYQARELGFKLGLDANQLKQFTASSLGWARCLSPMIVSLLEINPPGDHHRRQPALSVMADQHRLQCPPIRQPKLRAMHDVSQEDEREATPPSGISTTWRLMAPSAAWSTGPVWRWAPWTSSSTTAVSRPTSSMSWRRHQGAGHRGLQDHPLR
jgi:succinyl-CoA synthetase beta subunit